MKNLKTFILGLVFLATAANAQIVKVDRQYGGTTPTWAPKTAPATVKYYYLPDIKTYYDVPAKRYIYNNNGTWTRSSSLPSVYRGYDLTTSRPVYLTNYRGNTPYVLYKEHSVKFKGRAWKPNGKDNGLHKGQYKNGNNGHAAAKANGKGNGHGKAKGKGK